MNIMLDSQYNSRLEQPRRRILTSESLPISNDVKLQGCRQLQPLLMGISSTCIARSSNAFSISDHSHHLQAKDSLPTKCRAAKALFLKHKKRLESSQKEKQTSSSTECSILPGGFSCILKARSTVIRQNKLQQFYVNLTEEKPEISVEQQIQNIKFSFFKPNFAKKKTRVKRQSQLIQNSIKKVSSNEYPKEPIVATKKYDKYYSNEDGDDLILRERILINNTQKVISQKKTQKRNMSTILKNKRINNKEKQNSEFNLEPWAAQSDDLAFDQ